MKESNCIEVGCTQLTIRYLRAGIVKTMKTGLDNDQAARDISSRAVHQNRHLSLIFLVPFLHEACLFEAHCNGGLLQTFIAITVQNSSLPQYKIHRCHNTKFIAATVQSSSLPQYKIHRCHNTKLIAATIQNSSLPQYKIHRCQNTKFIAATIQNVSVSQFRPATDYILSPLF